MATVYKTKKRYYVRTKRQWRIELQNLYQNFLAYALRLSTEGSHLIHLPGPLG